MDEGNSGHALLPHLITYIPQRHPIFILHDRAPGRMFAYDYDFLYAGEGGRFMDGGEGEVAVCGFAEAAGGACGGGWEERGDRMSVRRTHMIGHTRIGGMVGWVGFEMLWRGWQITQENMHPDGWRTYPPYQLPILYLAHPPHITHRPTTSIVPKHIAHRPHKHITHQPHKHTTYHTSTTRSQRRTYQYTD